MAEKKNKRMPVLLILCAVFLLLLAGFFAAKQWGDTAQKEQAPSQTVLNIPSKSVTAISYADRESDISMSFQLDEDTWRWTEDENMPVKQSQMTSMLSQITVLTAPVRVSDPGDAAQYGLEEPLFTYTLQYTEEGKSRTAVLWLGVKNTYAGENCRYMKFTDRDEIYLVKDTVTEYFENAKEDWLDTEVLPGLGESGMQSATLAQDGAERSVTDAVTLSKLYALYDTLSEDRYYRYYTDESVLQQAGITEDAPVLSLTYTQQVAVSAEENITDNTTVEKKFTVQLVLGGEVKDENGGTVRAYRIANTKGEYLDFIYQMDLNTYDGLLACFS